MKDSANLKYVEMDVKSKQAENSQPVWWMP